MDMTEVAAMDFLADPVQYYTSSRRRVAGPLAVVFGTGQKTQRLG